MSITLTRRLRDARGRIVRGMIARLDAHKPGRYRRRELAAMQEMMRDGLLGGEGRDDSAEFLDWEKAAAGSPVAGAQALDGCMDEGDHFVYPRRIAT